MKQREEVRLVGDHVFHVHFKNQIGHGRLSSTLEVLLQAIDHAEERRTALVDEAQKHEPCFEGKRLVGKHKFHPFFGEDFTHFGLKRLSIESGGVAIQRHQKFLVSKMTVDAPLERCFK